MQNLGLIGYAHSTRKREGLVYPFFKLYRKIVITFFIMQNTVCFLFMKLICLEKSWFLKASTSHSTWILNKFLKKRLTLFVKEMTSSLTWNEKRQRYSDQKRHVNKCKNFSKLQVETHKTYTLERLKNGKKYVHDLHKIHENVYYSPI